MNLAEYKDCDYLIKDGIYLYDLENVADHLSQVHGGKVDLEEVIKEIRKTPNNTYYLTETLKRCDKDFENAFYCLVDTGIRSYGSTANMEGNKLFFSAVRIRYKKDVFRGKIITTIDGIAKVIRQKEFISDEELKKRICALKEETGDSPSEVFNQIKSVEPLVKNIEVKEENKKEEEKMPVTAPILSIATEPKVPRTAYLIDVNSDISPIDNIEFNEKDSITLLIDENSENLPIKLYKKAKSAGLDQSMQCLSMPSEKTKANEKLAFLLGIMCAEKDNVVLLSDNDTELKEVAAEFGKSFTTLKSKKKEKESKPNLQIIASKKNIEQITPSAKPESVKKAGSDVRAKLSDVLGVDDPQHQYANAISALFRADKDEATLKHDFVAILGPTKGLIYADKILAIFKEWKEA